MKKLTPLERAGHPNTPPSLLLALARDYPEAVLANPARELLALESPAAWAEIRDAARLALARQALAASYSRASHETRRRFLCGCAERVLWLYQRRYPDDPLPGRLLKAAGDRLRGERPEADLAALPDRDADYWQAADDAALGAGRSHRRRSPAEWPDRNARAAAAYAARAALQAARDPAGGDQPLEAGECPADAAEDAARAAEYHAISLGLDGLEAYLAERGWQAAHFAALLQEERRGRPRS
jgi:hypothetical protein